jgi:hypothetical protein
MDSPNFIFAYARTRIQFSNSSVIFTLPWRGRVGSHRAKQDARRGGVTVFQLEHFWSGETVTPPAALPDDASRRRGRVDPPPPGEGKQDSAIPRRDAPEFCSFVLPSIERAQGMPGAQCARSLACKIKKHTSVVTTVTSDSPDIPRTMVYGLFRALPGDQVFLTPSPAEKNSADLTPTRRRQDHTPSPSAFAPFVKGASTSTASRSASVTIASRPFWKERDGGSIIRKSELCQAIF